MTRRKKIVVTFACILGAAVAVLPLALRLDHVGSSSRVEKAFTRYVEQARHRGVRDVRCTDDAGHPGRYLCFFRYAGVNPFAIPKVLCVRLVADQARRVPCFATS